MLREQLVKEERAIEEIQKAAYTVAQDYEKIIMLQE
jgi:hypothetical protein